MLITDLKKLLFNMLFAVINMIYVFTSVWLDKKAAFLLTSLNANNINPKLKLFKL